MKEKKDSSRVTVKTQKIGQVEKFKNALDKAEAEYSAAKDRGEVGARLAKFRQAVSNAKSNYKNIKIKSEGKK